MLKTHSPEGLITHTSEENKSLMTDNFGIIPHPIRTFTATGQLEELAIREFWKVNTFYVQSTHSFDVRVHPPRPYSILDDDVSQREQVEHIVLSMNQSTLGELLKGEADWRNILKIENIEKVAQAYPALKSFQVLIWYSRKQHDVLEREVTDAALMAWEQQRKQFLTDVIRKMKSVSTVKSKSVVSAQFRDSRLRESNLWKGDKLRWVDGQKQQLKDLVSEMVKYPYVAVKLS